jgi:hypothetical protein
MKNKSALAPAELHGPLTRSAPNSKIGRLARTTVIGIVVLVVCLLAWPAVGSLDNPVTRPFKIIEGHLTLIVDPATGDYQFTDWGWATAIGLYTNSGSGVLDLATGEFISGSGVVVAANGDTIDWIVGTIPNTILDISGTGRFQGVTGGFTVNVLSETLLSVNPDGTVTLAGTYDGSGTLTY